MLWLGWFVFVWVVLGCVVLGWVGLNWFGLGWVGLCTQSFGMGLISQGLWIYNLYILRTSGKKRENRKEKRNEAYIEFETSCVI